MLADVLATHRYHLTVTDDTGADRSVAANVTITGDGVLLVARLDPVADARTLTSVHVAPLDTVWPLNQHVPAGVAALVGADLTVQVTSDG